MLTRENELRLSEDVQLRQRRRSTQSGCVWPCGPRDPNKKREKIIVARIFTTELFTKEREKKQLPDIITHLSINRMSAQCVLYAQRNKYYCIVDSIECTRISIYPNPSEAHNPSPNQSGEQSWPGKRQRDDRSFFFSFLKITRLIDR